MNREVGEMERSNLMQPGAGHPIGGGIVLKVGADDSNHMSVFEITVAPGFDVGAHIHIAVGLHGDPDGVLAEILDAMHTLGLAI